MGILSSFSNLEAAEVLAVFVLKLELTCIVFLGSF